MGETLAVTDDIVAETAGTLTGSPTSFCSFPGGGGQGEMARLAVAVAAAVDEGGVPGSSGCADFNGIARSGDPAGLDPFAPGSFSLVAQSAPEPAALALLGLALAGLALSRRGRR